VANARRRHLRFMHADSLGATADAREFWDCGCPFGDEHGPDCAFAETWDRLSPTEDLVYAGPSGREAYAVDTRGKTNTFRRVPALDRQTVAGPTEGSSTVGYSQFAPHIWIRDRPPRPVDVHPPGRRVVDGRGRTFLRRLADDLWLGWPRRGRGEAVPGTTDGSGRNRLSPRWLFDYLASRSVAKHVATLLAVRIGPTRIW
jgi:hypothetical protein